MNWAYSAFGYDWFWTVLRILTFYLHSLILATELNINYYRWNQLPWTSLLWIVISFIACDTTRFLWHDSSLCLDVACKHVLTHKFSQLDKHLLVQLAHTQIWMEVENQLGSGILKITVWLYYAIVTRNTLNTKRVAVALCYGFLLCTILHWRILCEGDASSKSYIVARI